MNVLLRLGAIGAVLLLVTGAFAYVGGWLSPSRLTQDRMMGAFAEVNGEHPGFRRNHAKGVCVTGWFDANGQGAAVSKATVFLPGRSAIVGRFALAVGMPLPPDNASAVRSMALRIIATDGSEWRTGMNDIPVFAVNSAQGFYDLLLSSKPDPATGKPAPAAHRDFLARHPEAGPAIALIGGRAGSAGFGDATYNSLDAFIFINTEGARVPVRWSVVPEQPAQSASAEAAREGGQNYLFDALVAQIRQHALRWHLVLTLGEPGDPTDDATLPWPEYRRHIDAGIVTLDAVQGEDADSKGTGSCVDINYDPLVLPWGMEPSDDPLLSARSSAYAKSFMLRESEKGRKPPSAVAVQ